MNLVFISSEYPPETGYGGIGTYTKHIAEGMASRGHSVSVIARCEDARERCDLRAGVHIHRISPARYPLPSGRYAYPLRRFCTRYFPHSLNRISWSLSVARKISRLLKNGARFDIIEAPECGAEGLFITGRMCKGRIIRLHTPWEIIRKLDGLREPWGDRLLLPILEKRTAQRAEAVSAPSQAIAALLKPSWRLRDVTVIPNPLPTAPRIPADKESWIYTGRIERRKGVHHLIAAYASVGKHRCVPVLKLIGKAYGADRTGTPYGQMIRAMIDGNNLQNAIVWIESADLGEVARHCANASVAFFPSLWENFPYACLEAMSCECAVVASDCGGFREIIESGKTGILVSPDSTDSIAAAMYQLLDNPGVAAGIGIAARKSIADLADPCRICGETERLYQRMTEC